MGVRELARLPSHDSQEARRFCGRGRGRVARARAGRRARRAGRGAGEALPAGAAAASRAGHPKARAPRPPAARRRRRAHPHGFRQAGLGQLCEPRLERLRHQVGEALGATGRGRAGAAGASGATAGGAWGSVGRCARRASQKDPRGNGGPHAHQQDALDVIKAAALLGGEIDPAQRRAGRADERHDDDRGHEVGVAAPEDVPSHRRRALLARGGAGRRGGWS
jgi:hypothetical protein